MLERPDIDAIRASLAETRAEWDRTPNPETRDRLASIIADMYLRDTMPALLAYIAELEPIVRAVAERDGEVHGSVIVCHYGCGANTTALKDIPLDHTPDCPVIRARALNIPPAKEISE